MDPDFYSKNPDPLNIRGGLGIREYMKKHGIEDTSTPLPRNPARKDGKYSGPPDVEEYMQDPDPGALIGDSTFGKMKIQKEDDMAWLRKAAGIGSGAKSNHGIHEGEEGYQITPRSLVAREMRKLQDLAKD
jgi:hypothetical protein